MFLGKSNINIAGMQVGRREAGGEAITIINVDNCTSPAETTKQISTFAGVNKVKYISL
jgi:D-3-phosphoglycerate dehydrogenase